ncbi:MAG: L-seryl-tRNA(Sec) selenium transferase [Planctomycetota bacterium]
MQDHRAQVQAEDPRGQLVPVYAILEDRRIVALAAEFSRPIVVEAVQAALAAYRAELGPGDAPPARDEIVARVVAGIRAEELDRLRPAVNATGIILHTGLGRAVLPRRAVAALARMDRGCNMQVDLATGERGRRNYRTERLLTRLTGAEAAMVVNNNAAATHLILAALCKGREVIVSQGQLIEIGGSFRLPDCIRESGAKIVPVGTTNRTHLRDYEAALNESTGAILRANPSNYRVVGFTKEVPIEALVGLKRERDVLVIDDLGCGALVDTSRFGLPKEATVQESIAAGVDLACFSGDKLIGGPQAGIIVGRKDLIARIKKHPMTRMMRVCKLTDVALEQTLRLFLEPDSLLAEHPTLRMLTAPAAAIAPRAAALKARIDAAKLPLTATVRRGESAMGGGSMPATPIPTWVVGLASPSLSAERLLAVLRGGEPPVIARIHEGEVLVDVRTLLDGEEEDVCRALRAVAGLA